MSLRLRWLLPGVAVLLTTAFTCSAPVLETDAPPHTDDTDAVEDLTSATRLGVPEEYRALWNTQKGCDTSDGPGAQVYWHTADATSADNGDGTYSFTATETWYWFNGDDSPADCKDVWEISGYYTDEAFQALGCETCEEGYAYRRTLIEDGCRIPYHRTFGFDEDMEPPDPQVYEGVFLLDTHNEFDDSPNQDNRIQVNARFLRPDSRYVYQSEYSMPSMSARDADDPMVIGPPGGYHWVGGACLASDGSGT